jgi:nicotinate-nucleotide--dimethylbenzimidazole phosphoribosyltransferase
MHVLKNIIDRITPLDKQAMEKARARQDMLTKPRGSLGMLEDLSVQIAGITGKVTPSLENKAIVTMAADHGVAASGVSLYPREVTQQMLLNFVTGGAAINVLARMLPARVVVVDMGVASDAPSVPGIINRSIGPGTADLSRGPTMSRAQALECLSAGINITEEEIRNGLDIVGTGDMGIGNTTPASAITAAMTGATAAAVTGRGTGIDGNQLKHKIGIIERALEINLPDSADPVGVLAKIGGYEIGGLSGVMLAAAANHIPVIIDGFISGAAALIACGICPGAKDYLIAAHLSAEAGHKVCLRHLGLKPLLSLDLRLGEGTGSALGMYLAAASVNILSQMATFSQAGVSDIK